MEIVKKERWVLFYDGACPLCFKTQSKLSNYLSDNIKLTVVDLNSKIAQSKKYSLKEVVLETQSQTYFGYSAWLMILSETKYSWLTSIFLRPLFILSYQIISKNKKIISKIMKL